MNKLISSKLQLAQNAVNQVIAMLNEGATVPFIARYRKERTGGLDEVQIRAIAKEAELIKKLEKRKETILEAIQEQGKLTDSLKQKILECMESSILEDLYLPYKKSRKTRADTARNNGLEPLAKGTQKATRAHDIFGLPVP